MLPRPKFWREQNLARRLVRYRRLPQIQKLWQGEDRGWMWINHPGNLPKGEQYCPKAHRGSHQHGGLKLMQGSAQLFGFMDMCWSWQVESRSTNTGFARFWLNWELHLHAVRGSCGVASAARPGMGGSHAG